MLETLIGLTAAALTTSSFIPQFIKAWRTKSTSDLSTGMFIIFVMGITLWLVYGLIKWDIPIIVANSATLVLAGGILVMKLKYG